MEKKVILKQTGRFQLQVCLSTHDLLLPPGNKGLDILYPYTKWV